jgi:D-glycero-D-manno-heptose 1,7-bisphosphate phosphatase
LAGKASVLFCCYHGGVTGSVPIVERRALTTVFLDRDGILNRKMPEGRYVTSWSEFELLPAVPESIARLNRAGLRVVVVSNQRCVALGLCTSADVDAIHCAFQNLLNSRGAHVDGFYFCPHDERQCNCRKPPPGLYEQAAGDFPEIAAEASAMIGDSLPDIEFGHRLGLLTIFIDGDSVLQKPGSQAAVKLAEFRFTSLAEAVDYLLCQQMRT